MVEMTLKNTKMKVLIQGTITKDFDIRYGVKQGDKLSSTIFNLILHYVIKDLYNGGHIMNRSYQILAYANDGNNGKIIEEHDGDIPEIRQRDEGSKIPNK